MTLTERLVYTGRQLEVLETAAQAEATLDDLPDLTEHLRELGEHGRAMQIVIDSLIEGTDPKHNEVQLYTMHAGHLFEAAQTFASHALGLLQKMHAEPA